jgi:hypothetical protein
LDTLFEKHGAKHAPRTAHKPEKPAHGPGGKPASPKTGSGARKKGG